MINNSVFPVGSPGFTTHAIERAAHLRDDVAKLMAMEEHRDARAYVLHRDSIVLRQETSGPRAALRLAEARDFGANPGTVFLGLKDGAPLFGMGIGTQAAEALVGRSDVSLANLRAAISEGALPVGELSTIAMAKALVGWHQRHGYCANCGQRSAMASGGWRRDCAACKSQHFPRTDPVVIMLVSDGERCLLGRQSQFPAGMWSCLAGFVEVAETIEDAVCREVFEEAGITCTDVSYYKAQPWPYPSSLMIGCKARATSSEITVDRTELEDARWFSREEAAQMLRRAHSGGLTGPHPVAIAYHLLASWVNERA